MKNYGTNALAWLQGGENKSQLEQIAKEVELNLFNILTSTDGYRLDNSGVPFADALYALSDYIPITANNNYRFVNCKGRVSGYNTSKVFVSTIANSIPADETILIPSNIAYIRVPCLIENKAIMQITDVLFYDGVYHTYGSKRTLKGDNIDYPSLSSNPLYGKTVIGFGDSIAEGGAIGGIGYAELIALKNRMAIVNYAVSGATIRVISPSTNNVLAQVTTATYTLPDYVLIQGYTNDAYTETTGDPSKLGEVSSGYDSVLDTSTFCGAFEATLKLAISKWPEAKKAYLTTHKNGNRNAGSQSILYSLVVQMCSKWNITLIDIYNESNLNTFITTYAIPIYMDASGAGSHPTKLAYEKFYVPLIEGKMKTL